MLVADGLIQFTVLATNGEDRIDCLIDNDGKVGENKNMNVPGAVIDLPAVTEKDKTFIEFGVKNEVFLSWPLSWLHCCGTGSLFSCHFFIS